jgi:type I restriction enzyme M protein
LWFVSRDRRDHKFKDRRGKILFIDARKMGVMIDRRHKELTEEDLKKIVSTYHAWRGEGGKYVDIAGFCKSAPLDEVKKRDYILTPGRYVGAEEEEEDTEAFEEKMKRLTSELSKQMKEGKKLDEEIKKNLVGVGFKV